MSVTAPASPHCSTVLTRSAPAKINLTLSVLGKRPDGFHELRSIVIGVGLYDQLTVRVRSCSGVELSCNDPALANEGNLAYRAAMLLGEHADVDFGCSIVLEKRIPVRGGLGGGSSDAAGVLELCNELWNTGLGRAELAGLGAELGSDVPLFFSLPCAVMRGRGERVDPVVLRWSGWVVLVCPDIRISTADVYHAWAPEDSPAVGSGNNADLLAAPSAQELQPLLWNDLEPAVFRVAPELSGWVKGLKDQGLGLFGVSGSGSTLFQLCDDQAEAKRLARKISLLPNKPKTMVVSAPTAFGSIVCEDN